MTQTAAALTAEYLRSKFDAGLAYDDYVATGNPDQVKGWNDFHGQVALTDAQRELLGSFVREINIVVVSGVWCGDCVQQVPFLDHIASASHGKVNARYLDRDEHADLAEQVKINGGTRVPVALFAAEDFEPVSVFGDRTLARYRAIAQRQIGAACVLPGAPTDADEVARTLADWVDETERVHLLLRLSTRLRQRHND